MAFGFGLWVFASVAYSRVTVEPLVSKPASLNKRCRV